jgi:hypothetical protein
VNIDAATSKRMVLVSSFLLAAMAVYRGKNAGDSFKALWGVGVVSMVLSVVADFAPGIAGPFAVLTVMGSFTEKGNNVIQDALSKIAAPAATGSPTAQPAAAASAVVPAPANPPPGNPLNIPPAYPGAPSGFTVTSTTKKK